MSARLLVRLIADAVSVIGRRYALYVVLLALTGFTEAFSLATVVPLLGSVGVGSGEAVGGRLGGFAVAALHALGIAPTSAAIGLLVVAGLVLSTLLFLAQAYVGARFQTTYVYRWQRRLAAAVFGARWGYFQQRRHGDLINGIVTETQRLGGAFYLLGLLLTGVIHSIVYFVIAATLSGAITAMVMTGGLLLFVITRPLIHRAYRVGTGISRENASMQSLAGELVGGAKLVKATATEPDAVRLLTATADRLRLHFLGNAFDMQLVKGAFDFGTAAMGAGILVASASIVRSDPAITIVVLAIFVRLMPKLTGVQQSLQSLSLSLPALEVVQRIAREAEQDAEGNADTPLPEALRSGPLGVTVRDLTVQYGDVTALSGVSLHVGPGSCVALVGGSGAGKSTLVDAVLGLVPVADGSISVNGVPLQELPLPALRRRAGYMGQDTIMYNGTIRDNLLWGHPDADARLQEAVRLAGADGFIARLPHGLDTPVGDRGTLLSGGERQRLALARAAMGSPGLLVLDEATSALDAETERVVTDALAALRGRTTVIMIAHRLSSIRLADNICVLEDGRVVEQGSWSDLLSRGGRLAQLWALQHEQERPHVGA